MGRDLVIRGARVYDGTGGEPFDADIAVDGVRISAVGTVERKGDAELDARGLAVAPGFIDVHSHDDLAVLVEPEMPFKVCQGVTTDVVGNCGFGPAPYAAATRMLGGLMGGELELPSWDGHSGYLDLLGQRPPSLNVAVLAGHGTLRLATLGGARRPASDDEVARMSELVEEAVAAGAVGLSTGLIYEPARHAPTEEIAALARVMSGTGRLYVTHMRNESGRLVQSVEEALRIGRDADVPVQISHHKASGRANWGRVHESLALIDAARAAGQRVTADQYPYTASSTSLSAVLTNLDEDGGGLGRLEPDKVTVASSPGDPACEGMTLEAIAARAQSDPWVAAKELVQRSPGTVVILETMCEDDVRTVLAHDTTMIGSDGIPAPGAKPHPRLYGTFPRVLGHYSRDEGVLTMANAVHKMTGLPAATFGLTERGVVKEGAFADLVVFDPAAIIDTATYPDPRRHPAGIHSVYVNGTLVVGPSGHTGARPGRALRFGQS